MLKIENEKIHLTKGDIAAFEIATKNDDGTDYTFQVGDVIRLNIFKAKDCSCIVLSKDVTVSKAGASIDLFLTSEETDIGGAINKPIKYWYEVILNPETAPQTIIGYDLDGAKEFILYPEGENDD